MNEEKTYTYEFTQEQLDRICALIGETSGNDAESFCLWDVYNSMCEDRDKLFRAYVKDAEVGSLWLREE